MEAPPATRSPASRRLRLRVTGAVQGVGMRPFLYRAARELGLQGWIRNDTRGVVLEMEGAEAALREFVRLVREAPPPRAVVHELDAEWLAPAGLADLTILASNGAGDRLAAVLPDLATCPACLEDVGIGTRRGDRRHGYAFTNCTDCGPRFSIIRALPYDRPNTTMAGFELCPACRYEYQDPLDRRFHAQPTACPSCGPSLRFLAVPDAASGVGDPAAATEEPAGGRRSNEGREGGGEEVASAAAAVAAGEVVAVKGLGGFHLMVDATSEHAVARLRARKRRPTKPLAIMVRDLDMARTVADVPAEAAELLASAEAPIVLLRRRPDGPLAAGVAPGNPYVGVMLPYTPLHHLLMRELDGPVVATSGNLSDEPICIDEEEARERLGGIADRFLVHDRPIERAVDDSVVQWVAGAARPIRRSRGYAPLPVRLSRAVPPTLAVGGHLKNTIALARGKDVFLSQHIGDLDTAEARAAFERVISDFLRLYQVAPERVAHDLHPDYASSRWVADAADPDGVEVVPVQHHHAHLAACLADAGHEGPALGVIWDGTGLGPDGVVWGGEFLLGSAAGYERVAHLRPFRLPGGDAAVTAPWRMALSVMHAAWGDAGVERYLALRQERGGERMSPHQLRVLRRMLDTGFRSPWTTSAGRLFDAVAALLGLRERVGFEGEAAMALEFAVDRSAGGVYPFPLVGDAPMVVDWAPAVAALLGDLEAGASVGAMAARFHNGLVAAVLRVADRVGEEAVALSGGCFQNALLTERTRHALAGRGLTPLLHRRVPANDGGLALGQVAVAAAAGPERS